MRIEHLSCVTEEEIIRTDGFAEHSAGIIVAELKEMRPGIEQMLETDFNLEETSLLSESLAIQLPIAGMKIVFTGKVLQASRDQMKKQAMQLGASVQSTVSAKTDMLNYKIVMRKIE